jgi:hypothetical protein
MAGLQDSTIRIYEKGWITYRDVFGALHKTTFCFEMDAEDAKNLAMRNCERTTAD